MSKYCFFFGEGKAEGNAAMKNELGGKGANLAEMTNLGLPVPAGFTISTAVCEHFSEHNQTLPDGLENEIADNTAHLEKAMGTRFGDEANPLLLSVRSGAAVSMPGMMDTVLNLGLNDKSVEGLAKKTGNPRFAWDAYRRFVQMFGNVVMNVEHGKFEHILDDVKKRAGVTTDTELDAENLKEVVKRYRALIEETTGEKFPQDPQEQLSRSIMAVLLSWNNERAIIYRRINKITGLRGTAVNIQAMVFGNGGQNSGTGVYFTRNCEDGANEIYGDYLINAQGEDVVAGIRTPKHIGELEKEMPENYKDIQRIRNLLEEHYNDLQDIEFTIQDGVTYILQTRTGKRTPQAAVVIAVDMVEEGLINKEEAIRRVSPEQIDILLHPAFDPKAARDVLAKGIPASPGAAVGQVVFTASDAEEWAGSGKKTVLVRKETSPEDVGGMHVAEGVLTAVGGKASHAALVARGMGKPCIVGCGALNIDYGKKQFAVDGRVVKEGDVISVDGSSGEVMLGSVPTVQQQNISQYDKLMSWVDDVRTMKVRTNVDTPEDAQMARERFGAEGIGLCRTEHMFFGADRIAAMREMILAGDTASREKALAKLLPMQRGDFLGIFEAMDGLPVTIRLLDPPLHEFLPNEQKAQEELAREIGVDADVVRAKVAAPHEVNPMLGHRGCRLGITYPEVTRMQARAIMEAACDAKEKGVEVLPEIMVPLTGTLEEMTEAKKLIVEVCRRVLVERKQDMKYLVGTMIEVPRAALVADSIAREAEFFSFGTNDLTQMTFGYSRDDVGSFVPYYIKEGILKVDPFQTLDREGVGQLVKMGTERGRSVKPELKVGICGEHGGDPDSVKFFYEVGLNYVSCSPYRVPIAKLAAAQAALDRPCRKCATADAR